jgi:hypothetical protein
MPVLDRRSLLGALLGGLAGVVAGDLFVAQPTQAAPVPTMRPNRRQTSSIEKAQVVVRRRRRCWWHRGHRVCRWRW